MIKLKIISRAVVIYNNKLLLVKNHKRDFWSLPGGHWEYERESLEACAVRETLEETGYQIELNDMVFCQELRKPQSTVLEVFWEAGLSEKNTRDFLSQEPHIDTDSESEIEEVRWFDKSEIKSVRVVPDGIVQYFTNGEKLDTFIGTFDLDS